MEKHILCLCLTFLLQQTWSENFVNIALHKTPTQDGTFEYPIGTFWDVSHSVDGRTECNDVEGQHYSATAVVETPWWQLDLGSIYIIKAMHLLGRPDQQLQLGGFRLWTGLDIDHLSMMFNANGTAYNNGSIWVNMTFEARVIKLDLPRDNAAGRVAPGPLTLCEVEVLICGPGFYGDKCSVSCGNCNEGTNKCLALNGTCPTGCAPGYNYTSDKTCKTACSPGYYGHNCLEKCGQCTNGNTSCLSADGTCHGCAPGYNHTDITCHTICSPGYYGQNCLKNCGHCTNGNTKCLPADGTCQDGCVPGYNHTDITCHTTCSPGYYGHNCVGNCGQCTNGNTSCLYADGTCQDGCAPGYYHTDRTCQTTCSSGYYGQNCEGNCGQCSSGNKCLPADGTCQDGCDPGYNHTDRTCHTKCQDGYYGYNCTETCGQCLSGNTSCSVVDGSCPSGCLPGYNISADVKCNQECNSGYYGYNCTEICGHCIDGNTTCSITDGTCQKGCAPGYYHTTHSLCNTSCHDGLYGLNCSMTCGLCLNGTTCLGLNGTCPAGCSPGYDYAANRTCTTKCPPGRYGLYCNETCGHCIEIDTCNETDGTCPTTCADGYDYIADRKCTTEISKISDVTTSTIIGVVVGIVVLLITAVGLVFVLKRRGWLLKRKAECTNGKADSEFVNLEALARKRSNQTKNVGIAATSDEQNTSHENGGYYSFNPGEHVTNSIKVQNLWEYITKNRANDFMDLFEEFQAMPGGSQFECYVAQRDENLGKNKYRNMYPYDHCRVKLKVPEGQPDYINASHVDGYERVQKFIAAQGPQKGTIEDFWLMVWQQGVRKVVMLTNISEMGKDKCEQYWPDDGASIQYGGISVTSKETTEKSDYISRKFELRMEHAKVRRVEQFHFKSWPDKDVPDSTWCLVNFWRVAMNNDQGKFPIVVHCSAGIGRTGTFIALDSLYHQAMTEGGIRPVSVIITLRRQRINMVQTKYQYAFLHEAVADALLVGTHFLWASQLPSVCNFFKGRNPEATVTRAHQQFKLICECIAPSDGQKQVSSSAAAENIYEETGEPMVEPEYGNISTLQSEISEYRPKTKDRNSASIQQLNAIYLPNYAEASTYILAEAPSESSLPDFWSLVEEQNVTTIVNLTETMHPCFQTSCTLGVDGGKPVGRFVVSVVKEVKHKEYNIRSIVYKEQDKKGNNAGFTVNMFSLSAWQQGAECPSELDPLIGLLEEVNKWHPYVSEAKPVLFICGDGRTRCGLGAAILNESQRMRNEEGHVNIVETVMTMKKRAGDVISAEQFQFLYEAVFAYARRMGYVLDTGNYNTA